MNARSLALAFAALIALVVVAVYAVSGATNTSTPEGPRPVAGITGESVAGVPDAQLDRAARTFFGSVLERLYRGRDVPVAGALPSFARDLEAVPVGGSPTTRPVVDQVRYTQLARGVRQLTATVRELADGSVQPLSAYFREVDGAWLATGMPKLDEGNLDQAPPGRAEPAAPSAAARVARAYALAARSWTATTYRAQYEEQLRLSTGALHAALERYPPTAAQLADRADAQVVSVQRVRESAAEARYSVVLKETTVTASERSRERTVNDVQLQLHDGRWLVSNFTAMP